MSGSYEQKIIKEIGSFLGVPFVEDFSEIYRKNKRINEIVTFLNEHPEYKEYIITDEKDETKQISDEVKKIFVDNAYSDWPLGYEQLLEEKGIENKDVYRKLYELLQQDVFDNIGNDFKIIYRAIQELKKELGRTEADLKKILNNISNTFETKLSEDEGKRYGKILLEKYSSSFWRYVIQLIEDNNKKKSCHIVGREKILREIQEWAEDKGGKYACIFGPAGIGKTRVAEELPRYNRKDLMFVYIGYDNVDNLLKKLKEDEFIRLDRECVFLFDYIYEKLKEIAEIKAKLEKIANNNNTNIRFIAIERSYTSRSIELFKGEIDKVKIYNLEDKQYNLSKENICEIIKNHFLHEREKCKIDRALPSDFDKKCNYCAEAIERRLDDRRPIYAVMVSDIYFNEYSNCENDNDVVLDLENIDSLTALCYKYWWNKNTLYYVQRRCSDIDDSLIEVISQLAKKLILITAIASQKIIISLVHGKKFQKNDIRLSGENDQIIEFIWKSGFEFFNYHDIEVINIGTTLNYFLRESSSIEINDNGEQQLVVNSKSWDIMLEWIIYEQYQKEKERTDGWLRRLFGLFINAHYVYVRELLTRIYRTSLDFKKDADKDVDAEEIILLLDYQRLVEIYIHESRKIIELYYPGQEEYYIILTTQMNTYLQMKGNLQMREELLYRLLELFEDSKAEGIIDKNLKAKDCWFAQLWLNILTEPEENKAGRQLER